jgi:hypothetical protein
MRLPAYAAAFILPTRYHMPDLILIVSLIGLYAIATVGLFLNDRLHYKLACERHKEYNRVLKQVAQENHALRVEIHRLRKLARDDMSEVAEILERAAG